MAHFNVIGCLGGNMHNKKCYYGSYPNKNLPLFGIFLQTASIIPLYFYAFEELFKNPILYGLKFLNVLGFWWSFHIFLGK